MTTFLLIRHGENDYAKKNILAGRLPGVHLNERGRRQALALAERLAPSQGAGKAPSPGPKRPHKSKPRPSIKAIYSSPLERAIETITPLAERLGLPVILRPALIETDVGEWQGQPLKRLRRLKVWRLLQHTPSLFRFPGGETVLEGQQRIVSELEYLRQQHAEDELVVCCGHSDPFKYLLAHYLGMPLDLFQRLSLDTGTVTALSIGEQGSRLLWLNLSPDPDPASRV